ncbi:Oplophorus-luciferin 2-monooxygenase non-catalytic subunit [Chionoecetes opilio]|uniref:Oplophorus-luciferin 2-monooxygenase non-catalytic subunit n=1 Tax=Chionoecetes opilio TaxID=41210 RepID=A0A8J4YF10_CHIOP|nr:Oplophorus-luciferin 2-monooxygenase non-catalytic subunit [Chionoecetes opilio]
MIGKWIVVVVVAWACVGVRAKCPSSSDISPCTCREVMPGRTMECSSVTSSSQLLKTFSANMPDTEFQFFQIVKLSGKCPLEKIPANVFGDTTFMFVWFGQTDITSVDPEAFTGNEGSMLELTIADATKLTSFPFESMGSLTSLYKLELTHTLIDTVTHIGAAPNLTQVTVANSKVMTVEKDALAALPRLSRLDLHNNPITSLPDGSLAATTSEPWVVYLDGCDISDISSAAFQGSLPAGVFLNANKMTAIPEATFKPLLEHMKTSEDAGSLAHGIDFTNNPLECDCGVQWVAQDATLLPYLRNAVCANGDVKGVNVADLPPDFFASC